jgi:hypothetical protein
VCTGGSEDLAVSIIDRFRGGLSVTVMGAAVALNQATSYSVPEDISPEILS